MNILNKLLYIYIYIYIYIYLYLFILIFIYLYSTVTFAPKASMVDLIFSASSFTAPSLIILGALSTNFLASTKFKPSNAFISLIILAFDAASKLSSLTLNSVFNAGASSSAFSASAAAEAAGAGAADAAGARAISLIFNLV